MLGLDLESTADTPFRILCVGAHCDDIEIGCGGTLLHFVERRPAVEVTWIVLTSNSERAREAFASAHLFLAGTARQTVIVHNFRTSFLPYEGAKVKQCFEELREKCSPNLIFTHHREDLHQDHRVVNELTWNTFRDHVILEYEIPKYDGDLSRPNVFVPLDEATSIKKAQAIIRCFPSQAGKHWFTEDLFLSLMRLRGMECAAANKYAEAFHCRKLILSGR